MENKIRGVFVKSTAFCPFSVFSRQGRMGNAGRRTECRFVYENIVRTYFYYA